jgi:hypothetical protein
MSKLEQLLNRVQRDLGGQVGSFRLKGPRQRFTGRSSVLAFADGMFGGDFALKFYANLDDAQREFAIYRHGPVCLFSFFWSSAPLLGSHLCGVSQRGTARGGLCFGRWSRGPRRPPERLFGPVHCICNVVFH